MFHSSSDSISHRSKSAPPISASLPICPSRCFSLSLPIPSSPTSQRSLLSAMPGNPIPKWTGEKHGIIASGFEPIVPISESPILCFRRFKTSQATHRRAIRWLLIRSVLRNPHCAMQPKEPSWLISGDILYFHYGHQKVNDKGWGCAYRSLQSLLSFFSLNHYVDMRVPSISEVRSG